MLKSISKLIKLSDNKISDWVKKQDCEKLEEIIKVLDDDYYNKAVIQFPDDKYDILKKYVDIKCKNEKENIGAPVDYNEVKLPFFLGSTDKIKIEDSKKLDKWISTYSYKVCITPKMDGVSALLIVKDGVKKLYTRGDGNKGSDISHLIPYIKIPKDIPDINVRGEIIISLSDFSKFDEEYKNPRNMVIGLIGSKKENPPLKMNFITYEILTNEESEKQEKQLKQ